MKKLVILLIMSLFSSSVCVQASLLGEMTTTGSGNAMGIYDSGTFTLRYEDWLGNRLDVFNFFSPFFLSDIGTTRTISPKTPDFDTFASYLTNGDDEQLVNYFWFLYPNGIGSGLGQLESAWITKYVESFGPDFYGYKITAINLTLNDMTLNINGDRTRYSYNATYSFYGDPIPEPATLLLLGLGGLALRKRK